MSLFARAPFWCVPLLALFSAVAGAAPRVRYEIDLGEKPRALRAPAVLVEIEDAPARLDLIFPAWLPGAYELRYFGRNVRALQAQDSAGHPLIVRRAGPTRVSIEGHAAHARVRVRYRTSAALLSDDGADVTDTHAYLNPGAIVPLVSGLEAAQHALKIVGLPAAWQIVSALPITEGHYTAESYAALIDGPIEAAAGLALAERQIEGARFVVAIDREGTSLYKTVPSTLMAELAKIVAAERALAGPLPFSQYLLLIHLSGRPERMIALEHAASTSIIVPTASLTDEGYKDLLHMIAHELFHAWNARRLVPAELVHWDPETPQSSRALWITEGLTEHASLVALHRARLLSNAELSEELSVAMTRAQRAEVAGLSLEELAQLAFTAPTALAGDPDSYYAVGHVVSLAIVAALLARTKGRIGLEELLGALFPPAGAAARPIDGALLGATLDRLVPSAQGQVALSQLVRAWTTTPFSLASLRESLRAGGIEMALSHEDGRAEVQVHLVPNAASEKIRRRLVATPP